MKTNQLIFKDPFAGLEFDLRLPNWIVIVGLFIIATLLGILNAPVNQIYQNFQLALIIFGFFFPCQFFSGFISEILQFIHHPRPSGVSDLYNF